LQYLRASCAGLDENAGDQDPAVSPTEVSDDSDDDLATRDARGDGASWQALLRL
jgi:hypothetical protein